MGKLSEALERHKEERTIEADRPIRTAQNKPVFEQKESIIAKDLLRISEYSPKVIPLSVPDSVADEHFKILRTHLLFGENERIPKTIVISSAFPGEGKTFVAVNLAVSLALGIDEHVLLIDGDLRCPQVHEVLGYGNREGLHECLIGKKQAEDLIIQTRIEKLSLLTSGQVPPNPTELLSSASMRGFLEENRKRYEDWFIIIDTAPAYTTAESKVMSEYADGVILVTMAQKTQREAIQKVVSKLGKDKIIGIVFNGYDESFRSYDKYYERY